MANSTTNTFSKPVPVLCVKDAEASVRYYQDALGFKVDFRVGDWFASVTREDCYSECRRIGRRRVRGQG